VIRLTTRHYKIGEHEIDNDHKINDKIDDCKLKENDVNEILK